MALLGEEVLTISLLGQGCSESSDGKKISFFKRDTEVLGENIASVICFAFLIPTEER